MVSELFRAPTHCPIADRACKTCFARSSFSANQYASAFLLEIGPKVCCPQIGDRFVVNEDWQIHMNRALLNGGFSLEIFASMPDVVSNPGIENARAIVEELA